jgi:hypothetical protein
MKQIIIKYMFFYKKMNKMNCQSYLKKSMVTTIKLQRKYKR